MSRIDLAIQFALAAAAQEEFPNNSLRAIHVIKYVYLADLAYAEANGGETFTGAEWKFFHFGPWASEVHGRVEPALMAIGARTSEFTTRAGAPGKSYILSDRSRLDALDPLLPLKFSRPMRRAIRQFGSSEADLLQHVYRTEPMLRARPDELLSFAVEQRVAQPETSLTVRQQKRQREALADLRTRIRARLEGSGGTGRVPVPPPELPEAALAGLAQLWEDEEAQAPIRGTLDFDETVWDAEARTADEIP